MRSDKSFRAVVSVAAGVAMLAALLILWTPFTGDQALFSLYAQMADDGALLYRDIWDPKQPGIFWFYEVAGKILNLEPQGVHLLEAVWLLGNSVLLAFALRVHVAKPWVAGLFPLGVGIFYLTARPAHLSQVEILVSPLLVWICLLVIRQSKPAALVLAGALAGVVGMLKLVLLAVPAAILLGANLLWPARDRVRGMLWFAVGAAIPVAAVFIWVWTNSLGDIVSWTWFEVPLVMSENAPRPLARLARSLATFALSFAVPLAMGATVLGRRSWRREPLARALVTAVAVGAVVTLTQFWWAYLFALFAFPVTALAVLGTDRLGELRPRLRALVPLVLGALVVPLLVFAVFKVESAMSLAFDRDLQAYQEEFSDYAEAMAVAKDAPPQADEVYVLGNPLVYTAMDADQSIPINGWSPETWSESLWRTVAEDLSEGRTEGLFVASWAESLARERAPWFLDEVAGDYMEFGRSSLGTWFVRRQDGRYPRPIH